MENSDTHKILIDGTFSVKAENGRYILYFEHLEDDQYILKRVKDRILLHYLFCGI